MSIELMMIKTPNGELIPLSEYDAEFSDSLKVNQPYKVVIKQVSSRNLKYHRLFFGGLIPFAFQYWQPSGGMIGENERDTVQWVIRRMAEQSGANVAILQDYANHSLEELALKRAEKFGQPETSLESFRRWLIIAAGRFKIIETPHGIVKEPESISFANMPHQEDFEKLYKDCADVVWNLLCKHQFKSQEEMHNAINEFLEMN